MYFIKVPVRLIICLLFVLFVGCNTEKRELTGEWYINPYHDQYQLEAINDLLILRLYAKGTFTQFGESGYCTGVWKRNIKGKYIQLIHKQGTLPLASQFLKIQLLEPNELTAGVYQDLSFDERAEMVVQLKRRVNASGEDPFAPALQTWRIKPQYPETEVAIRKRVINYLEFLQSLYKHAIDNHSQTGNTWYPSPLRMDFGGGVRMAYSTELNTWYHCFYDTAQAVLAYQLISGPIQNMTLKSKISKAERNLDCVEQLLNKIKR